MHPELKELVEAALADGVITTKEREVLHKKAISLGVDTGELDMLLNGKLHAMQKQQSSGRRSSAAT